MEYMAGLPDKAFDLAIVDPEYGIGAASQNFIRQGKQTGKSMCVSGVKYKAKNWDKKPPSDRYFAELKRVSSHQIIWGGNYFIDYLESTSCFIVWDKDNGENLYADCELAWTSFNTAVRKIKWKWHGMLQEDMAKKEERIHPTQKPVGLYKWLLQNYAKQGQSILDTHGGSRSLAIACYDLGFDHVSCELDADYHNDSKARFEAHVAKYAPADEIAVTNEGQGKLF